MSRLIAAAAALAVLFTGGIAFAQDDKEALKKRILEAVEKKLKQEEERILADIAKLIDEEFAKLKPVPPKPPDDKPKPKKRGYVGFVPGHGVTDEEKAALKIEGGVRIASVRDDGPAAKAGLREDDIIVAIDDEKTNDFSVFPAIMKKKGAGTEVKVTLYRGKEKLELKLVLGPHPDDTDPAPMEVPKDPPKPPDPKADAEMKEKLRKFLEKGKEDSSKPPAPPAPVPSPVPAGKAGWLGLAPEEGTKGLLVVDLPADSPALKAGIKKGDILTKLDSTSVLKEEDLKTFMSTAKAGQVVEATVLRDGAEKVIKVTLGERK